MTASWASRCLGNEIALITLQEKGLMNRTSNVIAAATMLAVGVAFAPRAARAQQQQTYKRDLPAVLLRQATVAESDAAKTAAARVKNGRIEAVELENEGGKLIYSYELKVAGKSGVEEVNVDAITGKVVSTEHESTTSEAREAAQEKKETKKPAKPTR
jgi:uncharacterized membrane protein YkoI